MAKVVVGGQVSLEHQTHPHSVPPCRGHVHGSSEGVGQSQLAALYGDDLDAGHGD